MENRLKVLRAEQDVTQGGLAEELGVSRQTINSIENGRYLPSLELAFDMAEFFDCSVEDIFYREG